MDTTWGGVELAPRLDCEKRDGYLHALGKHHAAGRLSIEELDRRVQAALAAETENELESLVIDLVDEPADNPAGNAAAAPRQRTMTPLSRWATAYAALASGGVLLAVVGPRTNPAEFAAGATAAMLGFVTHWVLVRGPQTGPDTSPDTSPDTGPDTGPDVGATT